MPHPATIIGVVIAAILLFLGLAPFILAGRISRQQEPYESDEPRYD